jgi:TRAP-type mannitol/chloroaromatic compound transport system permease small subunit
MSLDSGLIQETLPHRDDLPHTRLSAAISRMLARLAAALSWIWILLLGVIVLNVTLRYVFGEGRIEFEEIQWHLYSVGFLLGLSVCLDTDNHIRVDVMHDRLSPVARAWIELYGLLLLFFPFVLLILVFAVPFVGYSFSSAEVSDAAGGLPYRWAIKAFLFIGFALLLVAGFGRLLRVTAFLFGAPRPLPRDQA